MQTAALSLSLMESLKAFEILCTASLAFLMFSCWLSALSPLRRSSSCFVGDSPFGEQAVMIIEIMEKIAPTNMPGGPPAADRAPTVDIVVAQMSMIAALPAYASPLRKALIAE